MSELLVNIGYMQLGNQRPVRLSHTGDPRKRTANSHLSTDPVVSVRLPLPVAEALDALVERTGRSRGFYLRAAVLDSLPSLLERFWVDDAGAKARLEDRDYITLLETLLGYTER